MTKDDIIRMAKEARFRWFEELDNEVCAGDENGSLTRFAQLVAAAEREACAKLADEAARMLAPIHPHHQAVAMAIGMKIRART